MDRTPTNLITRPLSCGSKFRRKNGLGSGIKKLAILSISIGLNLVCALSVSPELILEEPLDVSLIEPVKTTETFRVTYYCGCEKCCGQWAAQRSRDSAIYGAYGRELVHGYSCASPLPNGTEVEIAGYGMVRVDDTTAQFIVDKYDSKIIDIYVDDCSIRPEGIQDYMEVIIK